MLQRGWGFVARHIDQERFCVLSSAQNMDYLLQNTVQALLLKGVVDKVFIVGRDNMDVLTCTRPCIVYYVDKNPHSLLNMYNFFLDLQSCNYIVLLVTPYMTAIPDLFQPLISCIIWDVSYYTNVPLIAMHCPMIKKFMLQGREALLKQGLILCNGQKNMCCCLDLAPLFYESEWERRIVIPLQRRFRVRRFCATLLQRAIKEWLYRPYASLGQKIVSRLDLNFKQKE